MLDDAGRLLKGHFLTQALNMQNIQNIHEGLPVIKHGLSFTLLEGNVPTQ